jgi:adenylosuccinate synthase
MAHPVPILIIQGAQYGSEAKGMVASAIGKQRNIDIAVRTGAINAGHTVYQRDQQGNEHIVKMQQLPVGWTNPHTKLVVGAGAYIHLPTLLREIDEVNAITGEDITNRLYIDPKCGMHTVSHEAKASQMNRHASIGATGKGCAESVISKIQARGAKDLRNTFHYNHPFDLKKCLTDTSMMLNDAHSSGESILIEGTQGTLLDLHQGPYPYTTSRMTTAANWVAEAGLSPGLQYDVMHIIRTMPIRVAGNSGPLPNEVKWSDVARKWNLRMDYVSMGRLIPQESLLVFDAEWQRMESTLGIPTSHNLMTPTQRENWSEVLSVLPKAVMDKLEADFPIAYGDISKYFEMTTVTKKLRRISNQACTDDLRRAIKIDRPKYAILTFLNYVFPELWGATWMPTNPDYEEYIQNMEKSLGVSIIGVTTGPRDENLL